MKSTRIFPIPTMGLVATQKFYHHWFTSYLLNIYHVPDTTLSLGDKRLEQYKLSICSFNTSGIELFSKSNTNKMQRNFEMCSDVSPYNEDWSNVRTCIVCIRKPVICMLQESRIIWTSPWTKDGDLHHHKMPLITLVSKYK